ncbi:MAG: DUF6265 family protein [Longimicrobiales bacterium]|nr:DUF6265 family protein [Longimicrobiales bacterium]
MPVPTPSETRRSPPLPRSSLALLLIVSLLAPDATTAQRPLTENTLTDGGSEAPSATLDDVSWLTGHWIGEGLGSTAEESWLPPAGGAMVGVFRLANDEGVEFYEIMVLEEEAGSLVLRLKHFGPDLTGWEEREETVEFPLVARERETLWFDGLTLRRTAKDEFRIWVALSGEAEPDRREALFVYRRAPRGPSPY